MEDELADIYRRHRQGLYTLALTITRCPSRAEDAVHDAFCRLLKSRREVAGDATAYVFAAVRNAARDTLRSNRSPVNRANSLDAADGTIFLADHSPDSDPAARQSSRDEHARLSRAIESLPDEQREAVAMHAIAGLTFDQVAEALDEPLQTIATRYRRALARLRELLDGEGESR